MTVFRVLLVIDQPVTGASDQAAWTVHHVQITPCRVTLLQPSRRAAVLVQPSSLRPHWIPPWNSCSHPWTVCINLIVLSKVMRNTCRKKFNTVFWNKRLEGFLLALLFPFPKAWSTFVSVTFVQYTWPKVIKSHWGPYPFLLLYNGLNESYKIPSKRVPNGPLTQLKRGSQLVLLGVK